MKGKAMKYGFLLIIIGFMFVGPGRAADLGPDALAKSVTDEVLAIVRADKDI